MLILLASFAFVKSFFRADSFDDYSCSCDTWYEGKWCGSLNVVMVTLTVIGCCWLAVLVTVAAVTYKKKYVANATHWTFIEISQIATSSVCSTGIFTSAWLWKGVFINTMCFPLGVFV